jgi:hypothetical protein
MRRGPKKGCVRGGRVEGGGMGVSNAVHNGHLKQEGDSARCIRGARLDGGSGPGCTGSAHSFLFCRNVMQEAGFGSGGVEL